MGTLDEAADDVPAIGNDGTALAVEGGTHVYKSFFSVDVASAAGQMALVYDAADSKVKLLAMLPIQPTVDATTEGNLLVANGSAFEDMPCKVILTKAGAPSNASDGWDGAYLEDTTTELLWKKTSGTWNQVGRLGPMPFVIAQCDLAGDVLTAGAANILLEPKTGTESSLGSWSFVALTLDTEGGYVVPEDGYYELQFHIGLHNAQTPEANDALVYADLYINGTIPADADGPNEIAAYVGHDSSVVYSFNSGPRLLSAGDSIGIGMRALGYDVALFDGAGSLICKRVG